MPFTYEYLVDKAGNFILDENGDKIIVAVNQTGDPDPNNRRVMAGRKPRLGQIMSFDIRYRDTDTSWHLTVNKKEYVGRFPSREIALAALYSMATACSGRDAPFDVAIDAQLTRGVSFIDSEGL